VSADLLDRTYRFEIAPHEDGWRWILVDDGETLAYGPDTVATVNDALGEIDVLWTELSEGLYSGGTGFEIAATDGRWNWRLVTGERGSGRTLAVGAAVVESNERAVEAVNRFRDVAAYAPVRVMRSTTEETHAPFDVGRRQAPLRSLRSLVGRGKRHRAILGDADIRIAVSGIRGKSSTVKRLDDVFNRRGYDTLTKITGDRPTLLRNSELTPIERHSSRVTLYENVEFFQRLAPSLYESSPTDVAIVENQAITEYTMRMVNERFLDPDIVVLCNVRQDHTDTLGPDRQRIARAFGRSIPSGAHVISGEQHPVIHQYLRDEVENRGATITQVDVPANHQGAIGAETVYALNEVLRTVGERPLSDDQLGRYLSSAQPTWSTVAGRRIFNAAKTNDIESTEAVRRALVDDEERVLPFVYLRPDRRGRTASFAEYLNILAERDCIDHAHAGGDPRRAFADAVSIPCTTHPPDADAEAVLEELIADGQPVIFMGNTVAPFMREIERLLAAHSTGLEDTAVPSTADGDGHAAVVDGLADAFGGAESSGVDVTTLLSDPRPDEARFECYEDAAGEFRWRFRDHEGTVRADSGEGYSKRGDAIRATNRLRSRILDIEIEVYEDAAGEFRWRALSKNGRIVADGTRGYDDRESAERAVERVRALAGEAPPTELDRRSDDPVASKTTEDSDRPT